MNDEELYEGGKSAEKQKNNQEIEMIVMPPFTELCEIDKKLRVNDLWTKAKRYAYKLRYYAKLKK